MERPDPVDSKDTHTSTPSLREGVDVSVLEDLSTITSFCKFIIPRSQISPASMTFLLNSLVREYPHLHINAGPNPDGSHWITIAPLFTDRLKSAADVK